MIEIDGNSFVEGTKTQVVFHPYGMQYDIPATVICGVEPGMTMLVTAQIHAGEYNGSAAVMRLAEALTADKLKGNLILLFGTFTPTSITVVEINISISPFLNFCIISSFSFKIL